MANVKATDLIDFTRASKGHALAKISYGSELVTNGDFSSSTGWTVPSGWAIGSGVATGTAVSASLIFGAVNPTAGKIYFVEFDSNRTSGTLYVTVGGNFAGAFSSIESKRHSVAIVAGSNSSRGVEFYGGTFTGTIDNVSVKEVLFNQPDGSLQLFEHPNNIPRIEYDADGNLLGLLIEESRTNVIAYSDFSSGWSVLRASLEDNAATSPDKQNNAAKLKVTTDSGYHAAYDAITGGTYMVSVFAKAGEYDGIQITGTNTTDDHACFNLADGTAYHQGSNVSNASIQEVGNGWYRCSAKIPATNGALYVAVTDGASTAWLPSFAGANSTDGIYIYGIQAELNASFPTSYIKTSGSTVTRSADVASIDVDQFGYNQSEGTFFIDITDVISNSNKDYFSVSSSGSFNPASFGLYGTPDTGSTLGYRRRNSAYDPAITSTTDIQSTGSKVALSHDASSLVISVDGVATETSSSNSVDTITEIEFGGSGHGVTGDVHSKHIKSITYTPKRLSNAKLQELTK